MNTRIYYSIQKNISNIIQLSSVLFSFSRGNYPEFLEINSFAFLNTTVLITRV